MMQNRFKKLGDIFANLPVKQKLMMIILSVVTICTMLTITAVSVYSISSIRQQVKTELGITATIISNRINAALAFETNDIAFESLQALSANPDIVKACVYNSKKEIFAKYFAGSLTSPSCPPFNPENINKMIEEDQSIKIYTEILDSFDSSSLGTLYIETQLNRVKHFITQQLLIGLIVLIIVSIIGFILARKLQQIISNPLQSLMTSNDAAQQYINGGQFGKGDEIAQANMVLGAMVQEIATLKGALNQKEQEIERVVENSESTFKYLTEELRQPLEATLAFADIISSEQLGEIDDKYVSYYNDIYLNVFYFYGITNDTMGFYNNHLKNYRAPQLAYNAASLIEQSLNDIKTDPPEFIQGVDFNFSVQAQPNMEDYYVDPIIIRELSANILFVFHKYLALTEQEDFSFDVNIRIVDGSLKVEFNCSDLKDKSISEILENHRTHQNDIHMLRSKLKYIDYVAKYTGGSFDYGSDLRFMDKIFIVFPLEKITRQMPNGGHMHEMTPQQQLEHLSKNPQQTQQQNPEMQSVNNYNPESSE